MTYYKSLFDVKVDADTGVRVRINECKYQKHIQQVDYSVHHEVLTQICFTCKIIRTTMPKDKAYLGLAAKVSQRLIDRLNEIIEDHTKTLSLLTDKDRYVEGKLEAYRKCLQLIGVYLE